MDLFVIFCRYDGIVHIDAKPSLRDLFLEDVVYHSLECGQGVCKTEEHYSGFEQPFARLEGCFPFVAIFDTDVVVSPLYIKFGKESLVCEVVDEFGDQREWVLVGDCPLV
jgi:hypothetical protein